MAQKEPEHRSAFVEAYEQQPRWTMTIDMAAVLGHMLPNHDGSELTRVTYRINTKSEDDLAVAAAHDHVARLSKFAGGGADDYKRDGDVLNDAKTLEALYRCCRDPQNPDRPLFVTVKWMRDNFETDTLAGLLNGYNEARARKRGTPWTIEDVTLDGTREMLVAAADSELPEALLAAFDREYLATLLTLVCQRWDEDRRQAGRVLGELLHGGSAGAIREAEGLVAEWCPEADDDEPAAPGSHEDAPATAQVGG